MSIVKYFRTRSLGNILRLVVLTVSLSCVASGHAQSRYSYSVDGAEVIDSQTSLVWRRCSEGQVWNENTCQGTARVFTYDQTVEWVLTQNGWRLPNIRELYSLVVEKGWTNIDSTVFPNTPPYFFRSSSTVSGIDGYVTCIYFYSGALIDFRPRELANARLVRQ